MKNKNLLIVALSPVGNGLSGGDRIFIEIARNASGQGIDTHIVTWKAGLRMCQKTNLSSSSHLHFIDLRLDSLDSASFATSYFLRLWRGIMWALSYSLPNTSCAIYSASDFWMDVIPSLILKIRFPKSIWAGTFYLAAPNPFIGFEENGSGRIPSIKGIIYYVMQLPIYLLIRLFAKYVFVTSEPDKKRFPNQSKKGNVIVIKGGVDLELVKKYQQKIGKVAKEYDAVFMGRFHPQKGVLELIDIWKMVGEKLPKAQLVMIGDGPLMPEVRAKIKKLHLEDNIQLTGYLIDGLEKYTIFAKSRIVVHPAIYDSGGMAAAEAMAWGLPGVSFDLEALKTYYPKGMLKCQFHNKMDFARSILALLSDVNLYKRTKLEAEDLIQKEWNWGKRAQNTLQKIYE